METIQERINEVTQLLEQLKIIQDEDNLKNTSVLQITENEEVIYDFESEEEELHPIKGENGQEESSAEASRRKRKLDESNDTSWNWQWQGDSFDLYARNKGYMKRGNSYQRIPQEYKPLTQQVRSPEILQIDCAQNDKEIFDLWSKRLSLEVQINKSFKDLTDSEIWNYILYNTQGNVFAFLNDIQPEEIQTLFSNEETTFKKVKIISQLIFAEFFGKNLLDHAQEIENDEAEKARQHLANIQICDLCLIENFICEYRKYFYQLLPIERPQYVTFFFRKLPEPFGSDCLKQFEKDIQNKIIQNTLGGAIQVINNEIIKECSKRKRSKNLGRMVKICCKASNPEIPQDYGCTKPYKKNKRFQKHFSKEKQHFPKKWKKKKYIPNTWKKKKFFKKKQDKKFCPSKKKDCRCWLCNEDGHYANKCPKKKKSESKEGLKLLYLASKYDLEPIENSDSELEDVYEYITSSSSSDYSTSSDEE